MGGRRVRVQNSKCSVAEKFKLNRIILGFMFSLRSIVVGISQLLVDKA